MNTCQDVRNELEEKFDSQVELSELSKRHLLECEECKRYYEDLMNLQGNLDHLFENNTLDGIRVEESVLAAFEEVDKKRNQLLNVLFTFIACTILGVFGWLIGNGYMSIVIGIQIPMVLIVPLLIPVLIRNRVKEVF